MKVDEKYYMKVHAWVKKHKPLPDCCERCGRKALLQYANLSQEYLMDVSDWACLCKVCHTKHDWPHSAFNMKMEKSGQLLVDFVQENHDEVKIYLLKKGKKLSENFRRDIDIFLQWASLTKTMQQIGDENQLTIERVRQVKQVCAWAVSKNFEKYQERKYATNN